MPSAFGNNPISGLSSSDQFAGDGTTVNFTLTRSATANTIIVLVSGVKQAQGTYSVLNKTLTFTQAPPQPMSGVSNNIEVVYIANVGASLGATWAIPIAAATNSADAITATYNPAITSLVNNLTVFAIVNTANTSTTPTFSPNGLTPKTIVSQEGGAVFVGQVAYGCILRYDSGTDKWVVIVSGISNAKPNPAARGTLSGTSVTLTTELQIYQGMDWSITGNSTITAPANTAVYPSGAWYVDLSINSTGGYTLTFTNSGSVTWNKMYGYVFDCVPNAKYRMWMVARGNSILDVSIERIL